ncbi:MAG: homoserine O-succinyltransferase [Peptoniphilus sp. oral taxon 375]|nr:homoserine O-succinyltransferase [Peptoniphilus sp. oral taxon 375]
MPLILPDQLIDQEVLNQENIFTMTQDQANHQDIRPIKILIVNLMPKKEETELQLLRMLSNSALQMNIDLVRMDSYQATHASQDRLKKFYKTYDQIKDQKFDAMIITGAPVERMDYQDIIYWKELKNIFDFAREHVFSTLFICWSAQAALYHYFGVPKQEVEEKIFGIYQYEKKKEDPILKGFDDSFYAPQSRYTYVKEEDLREIPQIQVLSSREDTGVGLATTLDHRFVFSFGHWEYDKETLHEEYLRDLSKGLATQIPKNYYRQDDPQGDIIMNWRSSGSLFFSNWLNYCVYQETPYQLEKIKGIKVAKFGGSSLASAGQFSKVKNIIQAKEDREIIVVSAPGKRSKDDQKVTDLLEKYYEGKKRAQDLEVMIESFRKDQAAKSREAQEALAAVQDRFQEIVRDLDLEEDLKKDLEETFQDLDRTQSKDFVLSRGEYLNAKILAQALGYDFIDAKDLIKLKNQDQLDYGETYKAIIKTIHKGQKVVVPGFYGSNSEGNIRTFKRGGSDYTGSIIASALQSEVYENWTDVSGIMTQDPNLSKDAKRIPSMNYQELTDLIDQGAQVYQRDAIDLVKEKNITLKILNTNAPEEGGTEIKDQEDK